LSPDRTSRPKNVVGGIWAGIQAKDNLMRFIATEKTESIFTAFYFYKSVGTLTKIYCTVEN